MTTDHQGAELKPCPFCGGAPELTERDVEPQGDPWYGKRLETFVVCGCGACLFDGGFHEGFYDPETRAIAAWNRRPAPAAEPAAWISDDGRAISHEQKARAERDGGASASSVKPYQHPCYRADHLADANKMVPAGGDGLPELPPLAVIDRHVSGVCIRGYTAAQMRQYALDALAARAPQWLPIEQAPKDGTQLLLTNGKDVAQGWWEIQPPFFKEHRDLDGRYIDQTEFDGFEGWLDHSGGMLPKPTHFMPLPAPPSDSAAEGGGEDQA